MAYSRNSLVFAEKLNLTTDATGLTSELDLKGKELCGILVSSSDWTAASITLMTATVSGGTFYPVHSSSGEVSRTGAGETYFTLNEEEVRGLRFIKVRSGTSGTPVPQAAARELYVFSRDIS